MTIPRRERERLARRAEMVAAAEKVFYAKGFEAASMDEIAREAQFTKRTLYQYFPNKEDLYYAVALSALEALFSKVKEAADKAESGLQRVLLLGEMYYRFSKDSPSAFSIMGRAQMVRASREASPNYDDVLRFRNVVFGELIAAIEQGKSDGSIRTGLDSTRAAFSMFLLITGFFHRLAEVGDDYTTPFGFDQESLASFTLELLSFAIRSQR